MKRVPLIHIIIATGFGSGFSPFAPGTAGALLATLIWLALSCAVSPTLLLIITALLIGIFTIAGIRSANAVEPIWGEDPSRVVVDEMVGVWIPLLAAPAGKQNRKARSPEQRSGDRASFMFSGWQRTRARTHRAAQRCSAGYCPRTRAASAA